MRIILKMIKLKKKTKKRTDKIGSCCHVKSWLDFGKAFKSLMMIVPISIWRFLYGSILTYAVIEVPPINRISVFDYFKSFPNMIDPPPPVVRSWAFGRSEIFKLCAALKMKHSPGFRAPKKKHFSASGGSKRKYIFLILALCTFLACVDQSTWTIFGDQLFLDV